MHAQMVLSALQCESDKLCSDSRLLFDTFEQLISLLRDFFFVYHLQVSLLLGTIARGVPLPGCSLEESTVEDDKVLNLQEGLVDPYSGT